MEGRALIALIVIIIIFSLLSDNYLTLSNLLVMTRHVALNAILAIGMLMVILNGGIDLSVGSTVGLSGVVAGVLLQGMGIPALDIILYPAVWVVIVCSLVIGTLVGYINGILITKFRVAPFVATLGMLYVARGAALLITDGRTFPKLQGSEELGNTGFNVIGHGAPLGIPMAVWVMLVLAAVAAFVLSKTSFGRWLYASGGNERAAELSGVPVKKVQVRVYMIAGFCAAIAGLIISSELTSAAPQTGESYELNAIAAVVMGGAALSGGRGNIRGTLIGAFVIGFLADGLVLVGVSSYWQMVIKGGVIVLAVALDQLQQRLKTNKAMSKRSTPATPTPPKPEEPAVASVAAS
nr:ABC transporter permease [Lysinibacter cavernae]